MVPSEPPPLRIIVLSYNKIQELPEGLFDNNLNLEYILLLGNKIKFIATGIFDKLTKMFFVDFKRNICINKYYGGAYEMTQLKQDIEVNCKNPNPITTIKEW